MGSTWSEKTPRVLIAADTPQFDSATLHNWEEEGFIVSYLPFTGRKEDYASALCSLPGTLQLGEEFALVAYGDAAATAMEISVRPIHKLHTLVCYYPTTYPTIKTGIPSGLKVLLHLAADSNPAPAKYPAYTYSESEPGFAETDKPEYDKVSARLAWSRTLGLIRKGFKIEVDLEKIWENHLALEFADKDVDATMATMVAEPYVNHIPTMTGGIGYKDLHRFYKDFFIPSNPPSMKMRLISRTIGTDRVVDEIYFKFTHTQDIPWLLPGVKPTHKQVEVIIVSVVCIRGNKLYHEHIYWDSASVLFQIGLVDGKTLPVVGAEAARKVLDEKSEPSNELLSTW